MKPRVSSKIVRWRMIVLGSTVVAGMSLSALAFGQFPQLNLEVASIKKHESMTMNWTELSYSPYAV